MKPGRVIALIVGSLMALVGFSMLVGGGALAVVYAFERGDDGYFDVTLDRIESATVAVTAESVELGADPSASWVFDALDADIRLRATNVQTDREVFVGIGREAEVDEYLSGVAHDEVIEVDGRRPIYRTREGTDVIGPPGEQDFWIATASGSGTQELNWEAAGGRWAAVVMNADGSAGVATDVEVGFKAGFLLPLAIAVLALGLLVLALGVVLIVVGASGQRAAGPPAGGGPLPPPVVAGVGATGVSAVPAERRHPVTLEAQLDPELSRWLWLVKWLLAIPHFILLAFLWLAFFVLTLVAGVAILFTARFPRGIFDFNVGVMRWTWRVVHYAATGGLGTDRYPAFSLHREPDDAAFLDVEYPEHLNRWLVLVKWFLAIPHLAVVAVLTGSSSTWIVVDGDPVRVTLGGFGLLGLLVLVAGVMLLFTGRYQRPLFDLIVGLNRWIYRVIAYVALMTDDYPPFRLDQGGDEPVGR